MTGPAIHRAAGRLHGKTAVVTEAGAGVGRAIALRFAAEGAQLILLSRTPAAAAETRRRLDPPQPDAVVLSCPRGDEDSWRGLAAEIDARLRGGIDILVTVADRAPEAPLRDLDFVDFDRACRETLEEAFLAVKHLSPSLQRRGGGAVVTVAPDARGSAAQCALAGGVALMSKALALEFAPPPAVRVNCLQVAPAATAEDQAAAAALVLHMASGETSYMTGVVVEAPDGRGDRNRPNPRR